MGCDSAYGRSTSQHVQMVVRPPPELLDAVVEAGGYWFDLDAGADEPSSTDTPTVSVQQDVACALALPSFIESSFSTK
eukprot:6457063-Prymnesium_polylepis.3